MNTFTKSEIIEKLLENNTKQPKAKYSNNLILAMLEGVSNDVIFTLEPTRNGFAFNRGSLVEEIVKFYLGVEVDKTQRNGADVNLKGVDKQAFEIPTNAKKLEIKFATTFAPASASKPATKYVLLVCPDGAFLIEASKHEGRYTNYSYYEGERLDTLSEMLGF